MAYLYMYSMAGYETTSQTVSYALWELAKNPAIQERLREECAEFLGEPSYDDMQTKLPYLDAILRETSAHFISSLCLYFTDIPASSLRMHPAVPTVERQSGKDDVIPLRHPIVAKDGSLVSEVHIKPGQV
jgi:cytochrome P450